MNSIKREKINQPLLISRPSTWLAFWALTALLPLYPFEKLPFTNYRSASLTLWTPVLLIAAAICLRLCESAALKRRFAAKAPRLSKLTFYRIHHITTFSTVVSLSVITFSILSIFLFSDLSISSSQQALEEKSPSFGKVLAHLRTIAIPGIVLLNNQSRLKWATPTIVLFFALSIIYSFFGGERLFFFETAFAFLVGRELVGKPLIRGRNILIFITTAILFFTLVEAGKRYFAVGYETMENIDFAADLDYFIERPLAYYADPTSKLHYVIEQTNRQSTFVWYDQIINSYTKRIGLETDLPKGEINATYWSSGYGYSGLTNPGGFTILYLDFGFGSILILLSIISISTLSLVFIRNKELMSLTLLHPLLIIAMFEIPRVPYIYYPRFWLVALTLAFLYIFIAMCQKAKTSKSVTCVESSE